MKLFKHERIANIEEMRLVANPMRIFVTRGVEIRLERGDKLGKVVAAVKRYLPPGVEASELVAFWYAMGERITLRRLDAKWSKNELSTNPNREYLNG